MTQAFPIYTFDQIAPLLDRKGVIDAVCVALIKQSEGAVQSPMPGQLVFEEAYGDCHIKFGHMTGAPSFAIKVATGFYDNGKRGLPVNNGLTLMLDAETGAPQCLFQDGGWMTAWRTAAATALAANCLSPKANPVIGIIGTGLQAQLAVEWIKELMPDAAFILLGRDLERTKAVAVKCGTLAETAIETLMAKSDIVITATPSGSALFDAALARPGMHFVGLGADGEEKQELPTALFGRATHILVDDLKQCVQLSDFGRAVREGVVLAGAGKPLGYLLNGKTPITRQSEDITLVDLTGLAAQDIAIANWFRERLG
jgi:ornithine cyclodeaminase